MARSYTLGKLKILLGILFICWPVINHANYPVNKTGTFGSVRLNKLILYSFPLHDSNNELWDPVLPLIDPYGYPDIIVYITGTKGKKYAELSGTNYTLYNASPHDSPHIVNIYTSSDIIDLSDTLLISVYDDDFFDPDDFMGRLYLPVTQLHSNLLYTTQDQTSGLNVALEVNDQ